MMSRKLFAVLLAVTVVAGLLLWLQPGQERDEAGFERSLLMPELAGAVNELDWLQIVQAGNETVATLQRVDGRWVHMESSAYPADWQRLRSTLAALTQAEVLEPKTSNPEFYEKLGVEDVGDQEAQGVLVRFAESSGLPAVIIGNSAQGRTGQYARLEQSEKSVLLDREIDLSSSREDWLARAIVDIPEDEVVEVSITHADGESIRISKVSAEDSDFTLQDIPEGKEVKSNWTVNSLAGALSALELDDVMPKPDVLPETAVNYRLLTAGGLQIDAHWFERPDGEGTASWLVLNASPFDASEDSSTVADESAAERAADINERVADWAYRVPDYKYDNATKRLADLLNDIEESADEGGEGS